MLKFYMLRVNSVFYIISVMKNLRLVLLITFISFVFVTIVYFVARQKSQVQKVQEVVFWSLQMGTLKNYMEPLISEFEKENPNIKIKWIDVPYSEGEKRTLASILSNTPPDLVNLTPDFSSVLAQKQALEFIDCTMLADYNPQIVKSLMVMGRCYAVPFYATSAVTFYNKEITNKSQLRAIPKTYTELNNVAQQIKDATNKFVTMPTLTENDTLLKILNKYNICHSDLLTTQRSIEVFDGYEYLFKNNLIPKESITQNHQETLEKYMSGQLAFIQSGPNFLNIIKENAPQIFNQTDVSFQLVGDTNKYDVSIMNLVIPVRAKNKVEALKFALFLTNKQNQIQLAKLTTVLPVNSSALEDDYFASFSKDDVIAKARCISALQLNNLQEPVKFAKNHKEIIVLLNTTVQKILLGELDTKQALNEAARKWELLNK